MEDENMFNRPLHFTNQIDCISHGTPKIDSHEIYKERLVIIVTHKIILYLYYLKRLDRGIKTQDSRIPDGKSLLHYTTL